MGYGALLVLLAAAPVWNGAVPPAAWAAVAGGIALAAVCAAFRSVPRKLPLEWRWWGGLVAISLLQLIPLPPAWVSWLSPARAHLAAGVADIAFTGSGGGWTSLSVSPELTGLAGARCLALGALFCVAAGEACAEERVRRLVRLLAVVGTAEGVMLLVQGAARLSGTQGGIPAGLGDWWGTYYNRNGLGNLLALSLPATCGLLLEAWEAHSRSSAEAGGAGWRGVLGRPERLLLPAGACLVQFVALTASLSRGALGAALAALAILGAGARVRKGRGRPGRVLLGAGVAVVLGVVVLGVDLDAVGRRWHRTATGVGADLADRMEWWSTAWRVFLAYPVIGSGLGTFGDAAAAFREARQVAVHPQHAHNDYLDALAVMGIPGMLLVVAALGLLGKALVRAARRGPLEAGVGASLAAFCLHAVVDFPTGYPANAAWAAALWGVLAARLRADPAEEGAPSPSGRRLPRVAAVWAAACGAVGAVAALLAAVGEAELTPVRPVCRALRETGRYPVASLPESTLVDGCRRAARCVFGAGEAFRLAGALHRARALGTAAGLPPPPEAAAREAWRASILSYRRALARRPALGEVWVEYADVLDRAGSSRPGAEGEDLAAQAALLGARLAPAFPRVALREADFWQRRARDEARAPAARLDARARAQAAYRRLLEMDGLPVVKGAFLHDAWRQGRSVDFVLGCIPRQKGALADWCFFQIARFLAAAGYYGDSDAAIDEWQRWRAEESERLLRQGDAAGAWERGRIYVGSPDGAGAAIPGLRAATGAVPPAPPPVERFPTIEIRDRDLPADTPARHGLEARGEIEIEIEGTTVYPGGTGRPPVWWFNPCLLAEVEIDGVVAVQTFLPLDPAEPHWERAGSVPPPPGPFRRRVSLPGGVEDRAVRVVTIRFLACEDLSEDGRRHGNPSARIRRLSVTPAPPH